MTNEKRETVELPYSAKHALYALQNEPTGVEWGGGIDFEIVEGRTQIERILTYLGIKAMVPSRVIMKYERDVEVVFHTHPGDSLASPSSCDLLHIMSSLQKVFFIVAMDEILIIQKTRNTTSMIFVADEKQIEKDIPSIVHAPSNKKEQKKIIKEIEERYKLRTTIIPHAAPVIFNLNVIKGEEKK